jgi:hypothetical protein
LTTPEKIQKKIRYLGALLFLLMNLFPPWSAAINPPKYPEKVSMGYHFITSPPLSPFGYQSYIVIDFKRLIIQWVLFFIIVLFAHIAVVPIMKKLQK